MPWARGGRRLRRRWPTADRPLRGLLVPAHRPDADQAQQPHRRRPDAAVPAAGLRRRRAAGQHRSSAPSTGSGPGSRAPIPRLNRLSSRALSRADLQRRLPPGASPRRAGWCSGRWSTPCRARPACTALTEARALVEQRGWRIGFPVEIRHAPADDAWLSTAHEPRLGLPGLPRQRPHRPHARTSPPSSRCCGPTTAGRTGASCTPGRAADLAPAYPRFDGLRRAARPAGPRPAVHQRLPGTGAEPMRRPVPETPGPEQESVWDYPRPPRLERTDARGRGGARRRRSSPARAPPCGCWRPATRRPTTCPPTCFVDGRAAARRRAARSASGRARRRTSTWSAADRRSRRAGRVALPARPPAPYAAIVDHVALYPGADGPLHGRRRGGPAAAGRLLRRLGDLAGGRPVQGRPRHDVLVALRVRCSPRWPRGRVPAPAHRQSPARRSRPPRPAPRPRRCAARAWCPTTATTAPSSAGVA